jgi:hypothetical protein
MQDFNTLCSHLSGPGMTKEMACQNVAAKCLPGGRLVKR